MATLDQLRALFPNASSDADVIKQAAQDFGLSPAEIASEVGFAAPKGGITSNQFGASIDRYQAGLYGVGEEIAKRTGLPTAGKWLQGQRETNELQADLSAERARSLGAVDQWKDVHGLGDFGSYAKGLAIQSAPYAAEALVGGLAGRAIGGTARAALAGGTAASYPSSVGDILSNQREQTGGTTNLGTAAALGIPYAALNALGETGLLARGALPKNPLNILDNVSGLKGGIARGGAALVKTGAEEAVGETGQEVINQMGRMSVDPTATLTEPEALERYKESAIGGFALGGLMGGATGWRRSAKDSGGDVGEAIAQEAPSLPTVPAQAAAPTPAMPPMTAPAVTGGTTDVALAQQQAQIESQQIQQAQTQQVAREKALQDFSIAPALDSERGQFLGKPIFGPMISQVADAVAPLDAAMAPHQREITQAIIQANADTGNKLVSFSFNANNPQASVQKGFETIAKAANKFQIAHVQSVDEAAKILDTLSQSAKKNELEQINAIYQALTGEDTSGYVAEQQSKAAKGAKNGKLQNNAGVREVPVQGGTGEASAGGNGSVRPAEVQPVGAGSVGAGSLGLQVGQPSASGVRPSADAGASVGISEPVGPGQGQGQVNVQPEAAQNSLGGGQVSGQPEQAAATPVGEQNVQNGPRVYATPPSYYATDLSHIQGERRIAIINELFTAALKPSQERKNTVPAEKRAEILRLALMEQFPHKTIAELTGIKVDTVEKQLERMGVQLVDGQFEVVDPKVAVAVADAAANFRSAEFPDGIGEGELTALYTTRYEGEEEPTQTLAEEMQQEGKPEAKLAEELHGKENGPEQTMGTIATAGGSQGAVEGTDDAFFAKVGKLQAMLDITPDTDTAGKANLKKQIDALWAQYAKKQAVRAETGEVAVTPTEEEETNAVQEPSPATGNVRKPARNRKAVGEGNTQGGEAAGAGQAQTQEEVKTPAEQWAALASEYPAMPTYESLPSDQRARWDDLAHNGAPDITDVARITGEVGKPVAAENNPIFRSMRTLRDVTATDLDGVTAVYEERDLNDLEKFPGVRSAMESYRNSGMGHLLDSVGAWYTTYDNVNWDGAFTVLNGQPSIAFRADSLFDHDATEWTTHHEVGHAIDQIHLGNGGVFSGLPELNVSVMGNKIRAHGEVMQAVLDDYTNNPTGDLAVHMKYPFDRSVHTDLNAQELREEVFAQLWAAYNTRDGRAYLEDNLPTVADFMETVYDEAKQTQYSAAPANQGTPESQAVRAYAKGVSQPGQVQGGQAAVPFRANRSQTFSQGLDKTLPPSIARPAKTVVTTLGSLAKKGLLAIGITEDIVNLAAKFMPTAKQYLTAQYDRQKTRIEFEQRIERILEDFDKLPKNLQGEGKGSVNEFIYDSTMEKKWGFYPGEHRVGTTLFEVDPEFKARFNAFPASAQSVIKQVFEHGYQALMLKQKAVADAIASEYDSRIKDAKGDQEIVDKLEAEKAAAIARESRLRGTDISTPYAYLGRYGDFVVVAKSKEYKAYEEAARGEEARVGGDFITGDPQQARNWLQDNVSNPDHYVVHFTETQAEADEVAAKLQATGKYDIQPEDAGEKEAAETYTGGDMSLAVSRLRHLVERQIKDGSMEATDATTIQKMVNDLYLMTVAESSARKSEIQRLYVTGADKNMMRNLATSGRADAHFLSTLEHGDKINAALESMRGEARDNRRAAMPLYNELIKRHVGSMEYKTPSTLGRALTKATSVWFLATSPAFYLQQMVQTGVISLPYMAGRLGYFRSARAIKTAYGDLAKMVKDVRLTDHIDFDNAPADVRNMLKTLVGMGKIDIGIDADTKARADENTVLDSAMRKLQNVNNRIEAVNRSVAAIAAYRGYLERYKNGDTAAATQYAADVVSNTHGSYDGFNTPRVMNSEVGRIALQFKRFQIIQLSMLAKLIHNAFKGASAEEKAVARQSLAFLTGHMAAVGGALGIPFVQQLGGLLLKAFGDEDEPDDLEYTLRKALGNDTIADMLINGVPSGLGVNLGGKLGMGNVASVLPFTDVDLSTRSGYEKAAVGLMGPFFGGLAPKMIDGVGTMAKGEYYKGLELLLPNGIANAMKGVRYLNEGISMRNGDVVMKPEDISLADAAFQAVGLPTTTITDRQFTQRVVAEFDKFYASKATAVKGAYISAARDGNYEAMADARQDWADLQESRAKNGYTREPLSALLKAPMEARKREAKAIGGVEYKKSNRQFVANLTQG